MSFRAGFCGLIGLPNAGKSSLMNWLVEDKVSIVTPKPQTTRRRILGLWSVKQVGQVVFVDAPGLIQSTNGLNAFLQAEAEDVIKSSDILLFVLNLDERKKDNLLKVLSLAKSTTKTKAFILNKVDLQELAHRRRVLRDIVTDQFPGTPIFEVSTTKKDQADGPGPIRKWALDNVPPAEQPLYDPEIMTPHSMRELAIEFVREQCFLNLHQEIPYGLNVRINKFEEEPGLFKIYAEILVSREGHKAIVIGQKAAVIKQIGTGARKQMEKAFDSKVFLDLHVNVVEAWDQNPRLMKEFGYVVD